MPSKVCSVRIPSSTGYANVIPVQADSRNEAAALALEQLIARNLWSWDPNCPIEVTVHEPKSIYTVRPKQILEWANRRSLNESIGVMALRHRIKDFFASQISKSAS